MSDALPRKRMISLRLSDGEYAILRARYHSFGARNVSDFARRALAQMMQEAAEPNGAIYLKIESLENRVRALELQISALSTRTA